MSLLHQTSLSCTVLGLGLDGIWIGLGLGLAGMRSAVCPGGAVWLQPAPDLGPAVPPKPPVCPAPPPPPSLWGQHLKRRAPGAAIWRSIGEGGVLSCGSVLLRAPLRMYLPSLPLAQAPPCLSAGVGVEPLFLGIFGIHCFCGPTCKMGFDPFYGALQPTDVCFDEFVSHS